MHVFLLVLLVILFVVVTAAASWTRSSHGQRTMGAWWKHR